MNRFVYKSASDSVVGAERDIIRDFMISGTQERIDLSAFLGTFTFRGTDSFNSVFREVSYSYVGGNTLVKIDLDFDVASEMEILLIGREALTASDFILWLVVIFRLGSCWTFLAPSGCLLSIEH